MPKEKCKFVQPPFAGCIRRKTEFSHASKQFWYWHKSLPYTMNYWFMLAVYTYGYPLPREAQEY